MSRVESKRVVTLTFTPKGWKDFLQTMKDGNIVFQTQDTETLAILELRIVIEPT